MLTYSCARSFHQKQVSPFDVAWRIMDHWFMVSAQKVSRLSLVGPSSISRELHLPIVVATSATRNCWLLLPQLTSTMPASSHILIIFFMVLLLPILVPVRQLVYEVRFPWLLVLRPLAQLSKSQKKNKRSFIKNSFFGELKSTANEGRHSSFPPRSFFHQSS